MTTSERMNRRANLYSMLAIAVLTAIVAGLLAKFADLETAKAALVGGAIGIGLELVSMLLWLVPKAGGWAGMLAYVLKILVLLVVLSLLRAYSALDETVVALVAAGAILVALTVQTVMVMRSRPALE
ncbi:hypothetical protein SAMN05421878_10785 [Actinobaculum suis]|uniref:Uncharacterized protein n=1 Tax=Actinobaculum suis TaxID=1657 RepID=A0A1B9BD21_9ACTO|nr:hypothetical protein [Actinobaculum suis]MDY5152990.1 hypothetical protein [Actinobaculum suis]OCA94942.1 hypothetical protein ACU21_05530 [Actinobaculum suis]SDE37884.1 hypothetical protein SAMN05421878_10785 [Actinobaculum suis]VDG77059.1 Uncharacterised protein [Actinobaculum suis]